LAKSYVSFVVSGRAEMGSALQKFAKDNPKRFGQALYTEALLIEQVSRERTPVLTGVLRASHETSLPTETDPIEVQIRVGGPAAPYALYVHEKLEARHKVGQAKFLESAVLEGMTGLAERIAERLKL